MVATYKDKRGSVIEATIDMSKIARARHYMTKKMLCPIYGTPRCLYRLCDEIHFIDENMTKLRDSLTDPDKPSEPKKLRKMFETHIHARAEKPIKLMEFQNWMESGYRFGCIIWEEYKFMTEVVSQPANAEQLFVSIQQFISANAADKSTISPDDVTVTLTDIVKYAIAQTWLYGKAAVSNYQSDELHDGTADNTKSNLPDSLNSIIYDCAEELELLSREYSNDEGAESSVAAGACVEIETEHPQYLIQKGMQRSVLHRVPLPQPKWDNPLPEHTPGFLQMLFPFVFLSGDADPYQERPIDIKQPKSTWEEKYMEKICKWPRAQQCPRLQFWIQIVHNGLSVESKYKLPSVLLASIVIIYQPKLS